MKSVAMAEPKKIDPELKAVLRAAGSKNIETAHNALKSIATALELPLRKGILRGNIIDFFTPEYFEPGVSTEYPLDFLTPGTEQDFSAYVMPQIGQIASREVQGDYIMVHTFGVSSSIDFSSRYARDARWPILERAVEVLAGSFTRLMNTNGWRTVLGAGASRNLIAYDDQVVPGFLSKRLIETMKIVMRRQAGGNTTSVNQGKLTRLYVSTESMGDIRGWDLSQVDDFTRREIYMAEEQGISKIWGVELRDLVELGVGQEFENFYESTLGGTLPSYTYSGTTNTKTEICVGLDLQRNDSFVMPVREEVELFADTAFHRQGRIGLYGTGEHGFGCLDSRRVLIGAI